MLAEQLSKRVDYTPAKSITTVSELDRAGMGLRVSCRDCGKSSFYAGRKLKEKFGANTSLRDIKEPCECGSPAVSQMPETIKS